jgi:spermidine synthase
MRTKKIKGKHFVLDLYGCNHHEINSPGELEQLMMEAARAASMEVLHVYMHKFDPHGVTGVVVLSTSHISVHTWPEYGYAAFDVFSCSDEARTRMAVNYITQRLTHSKKKMSLVDRGYAQLCTINIPIYKTNTKREVQVLKKIAEIKSPFQTIQVLDLEESGRTLLIDGIPQVSVQDTELYDRAITKKVRKTDKRVLILGGGDGFVAKKVLEKSPEATVTVVELDPEVVYCAREYFDQGAVLADPRVNLVIGDAMQFLAMENEKGSQFDVIIVDLTDNPVGGGRALAKLNAFYERLLTLAVPLVRPGGWISSQAGVRKAKRPLVTTYEVLLPLLNKQLSAVEEEEVFIPSYLESNVFLHAQRK